ncbi:2-phospho-L-lactate guanylyltransferase [Phenylobacterium montanum]|uniref:3-phospho-D-glycerate guanylyltransferase n=1 Tax=Phenylobacterium montanum TaxID=2823693 RepID=A0A975G4I8_9CAUL|nr:2-phospho-L-lactate guanylyltransferase [Caulobacter sp. S6]QUD90387.1 2-phospho-L-lactate guanylyltransferase [Caulobacter sp. S6]
MTQVVIAVRGGPGAKSRLAPLLTPAERERLTGLMLEDMLAAARRAKGVRNIFVVTPTPAIATLARRLGAEVIRQDAPNGLNAAFEQALGVIGDRAPYSAIALLMGDLPLIEPNEIEAAIALSQTHAVVLAPAATDGGTGALILRAGARIELMFGPQSFQRHRAAARLAGLSTGVVEASGLSRDLDRPEDLAALAASPSQGRAARFLRQRLSGRIAP